MMYCLALSDDIEIIRVEEDDAKYMRKIARRLGLRISYKTLIHRWTSGNTRV